MEPGERLLIRCEGGPSRSRLERFPPPPEVTERDGIHVLVDDDRGDPSTWFYQYVPDVT